MRTYFSWIIFLHCCILSTCSEPPANTASDKEPVETLEDLEAREDSVALVLAYEKQAKIELSVTPAVETHAVHAQTEEDAADDPAFWINPADPALSLIIGSNKRGGIATYDLTGSELDYYPVGNINNIDVVYGFTVGDKRLDLVGGSNRSDQSIDLFKIDPDTRKLVDISARPFLLDTTLMNDVYGFCFYQNPKSGATYVMINAKNGRFQQYQLVQRDSLIDLELVRERKFATQVEGMVADHVNAVLYLGEEGRGVWKMGAEPTDTLAPKLIAMSDESNPNIAYDVEGVTLYEKGDQEGYLIVSSQGNFSYAVFDRQGDNPYLFSFKITASEGIDGVEETDGIEAISANLGPAFPKGIFIAQDGFNYQEDQMISQNFKVVRWEQIEALRKAK